MNYLESVEIAFSKTILEIKSPTRTTISDEPQAEDGSCRGLSRDSISWNSLKQLYSSDLRKRTPTPRNRITLILFHSFTIHANASF